MDLRKKIINFNLSRNIEKALLLINSSLIKEVSTYSEITNGDAGLYYLTVEDNTDPNDVKEIGEYVKLSDGSIKLTNPYFTETFNVGQIYGGSNVYDYPYGSGNLGEWYSFHHLYGVGGYSHVSLYGATADINPVSVPPIYTAKQKRIKLNKFQIFGTPYTNPYYVVKILKIDIKNNVGLSTLMSEQEFQIIGGFGLQLDASIDNGKLNDVIIEKGESIIVLWKCTDNSRPLRRVTFNLKFEKI